MDDRTPAGVPSVNWDKLENQPTILKPSVKLKRIKGFYLALFPLNARPDGWRANVAPNYFKINN